MASTSAIPYNDTIPAMGLDESEAATSEEGDESEEVEAAVISRGRRSNAGSRYAVPHFHTPDSKTWNCIRMRALLDQEESVEAEDLFAEEADDQDFAVIKGESPS